MGDSEDDRTYGTAPRDAPVTRADLERAIRSLHTHDMLIRDQLIQLAAQVVALTDELTRRLDGVEPQPAPPQTPAQVMPMTIENAVALTTPEVLVRVRASDARYDAGVSFAMDDTGDKYEATPSTPPCAELIPICHARCCKLRFALSTQDLDEGIIRWDYGRPYMIRQRSSDERCVHNDPETRFCTVHAVRPKICRTYHCQDDKRIWTDYEARIPAPEPFPSVPEREFDLMERARVRSQAMWQEHHAITESYAEQDPRRGPKIG
ncbi:MAG: YkgJ family cysteine cluster protein [Myxococcales bacterium]|nr:YkgJ family cysteine cluster protein [Myxococcales bacterium]